MIYEVINTLALKCSYPERLKDRSELMSAMSYERVKFECCIVVAFPMFTSENFLKQYKVLSLYWN